MKSNRFSNNRFFFKFFFPISGFFSTHICLQNETDPKVEQLFKKKLFSSILSAVSKEEQEKIREDFAPWLNSNLSQRFKQIYEIYVNETKIDTITYEIYPLQAILELYFLPGLSEIANLASFGLPSDVLRIFDILGQLLHESRSVGNGVAEFGFFSIFSSTKALETLKIVDSSLAPEYLIGKMFENLSLNVVLLKDYFLKTVNPNHKLSKDKFIQIRQKINNIITKSDTLNNEMTSQVESLISIQVKEMLNIEESFKDLSKLSQDEKDNIAADFFDKNNKKTYVVSEQNFLVPKKEMKTILRDLKKNFLVSEKEKETMFFKLFAEKGFTSISSFCMPITTLMDDKFAEYYKNSEDYSSVIESSNILTTELNSNVACLGSHMIIANDLEISLNGSFDNKEYAVISLVNVKSFEEKNLLNVTNPNELISFKEVNKKSIIQGIFEHVMGNSKITNPTIELQKKEDKTFGQIVEKTITARELFNNTKNNSLYNLDLEQIQSTISLLPGMQRLNPETQTES